MNQLSEQIVTRPEELQEVCDHLRAAGRFGFDTEFVGEDTYRPRLCLIQVSTTDRLVLIDPFEVGSLDEFWDLIVSPACEVVVHAGREEVRLCQLWTGRAPTRLFDLQIAAGLVGLPFPISHGNLVAALFDVNLSKAETLTEWRDRPLTRGQIAYAFDDVRYLLPSADELSRRLAELGRIEWANEEFARLVKATVEEPSPDKWRKLRGLGGMNPRQLAVARELYAWREETAFHENKPARAILRDDLLVEIARRMPTRDGQLHHMRGMRKRDRSAIVAAVRRGHRVPADQCPPAAERVVDSPMVGALTHLIHAVLIQLCDDMRLASSLVCSASELRALVRREIAGVTPTSPLALDQGWRRDHVRCVLDAVLRGRCRLQVHADGDGFHLDIAGDAAPDTPRCGKMDEH